MKRRFTEEQIVRILQEAEIVGNVREVCRQHNITAQTYYRWWNKFERIGVGYMKRVRALEQENAALKRLVGELSLDNRMLRDVREKK